MTMECLRVRRCLGATGPEVERVRDYLRTQRIRRKDRLTSMHSRIAVNHRELSSNAALLGFSLLVLAGCAAQVDGREPERQEDEIAVTAQAVSGGSTVTRVGVVALSGTSSCTGVLINRFTILSAGHCFATVRGGRTKRVSLGAVYKRPDGSYVCLTGGGVYNEPNRPTPYCLHRSDYDVSVYPGFIHGSNDAAKDFAVVRSLHAFTEVSPSDYALIDADGIDSNGRLEFYGYGAAAQDGTGSRILRVGAGEVEGVHPQHVNLEGGGARACDGDSGGPTTIYFNQTSPDLLAIGVASNADVADDDDACAEEGGKERFSRIAPKIDFVIEKSRIKCRQITHSRSGRIVRRCFNPPIAFFARANGKYVQVGDGGSSPLIAAASQAGPWERFERIDNTDGSISLVSLQNHKLVTTPDWGNAPLIAEATVLDSWEKFWLEPLFLDGGFNLEGTALVANSNNNYVMADDAGASPLIARTSWAASFWEQFFFQNVP
jgi:hypothetical protein